jgi:hypothetical protein
MSLLLLFGGAPATQAGFISPLARATGGAGAFAQAGFYSVMCRWVGGAGSVSAGGGSAVPNFILHYRQQGIM